MYIMYLDTYIIILMYYAYYPLPVTTSCLISDVMKAPQSLGSPQFVPRKCDSYGEGHTFPAVNKKSPLD